jgi:hypothetical protein
MKYTILIVTGLGTRQRRIGRTILQHFESAQKVIQKIGTTLF